MTLKTIRPLAFAALALTGTPLLFAQHGATGEPKAPKVDFPAPSPAATVKQRVGLTDFEIVYSRPGVREREIFGGLVPYGSVWRTGANAPTKLTVSTPVKFNGKEVPAGTYALYSIPGAEEWTVIVHKYPSGSYKYDEKNDVARVKAKPVKLSEAVETFTIDLNDLRDQSATLNLTWDKTRVPVKVEVDYAAKLLSEIDAAMATKDKKPAAFYHNAARFYFEQGKDPKQALAWVNEAIASNPKAFWMMHLKARILAKLGDKEEAIAAAKKSSELAVAAEGANSGYVKMNEDLIASLR